MNLQNIIIDFNSDKITVLLSDLPYSIENLSDKLLILKESMINTFDINIERIIEQLSEDQHLSEPRIILNPDNQGLIITISEIETNHSELMNTLNTFRIEVETELTILLENQ